MAETPVWQDRKRIFFGLPWTFTVYRLTEKSLIVKSGVINVTEEEIRLYRIQDITLKRSLWERLCGLGTLHLCSSDKTAPELDIKHIKHPREVRTLLSDMVEKERAENINIVGFQEAMNSTSVSHN